MKIKKIIILLIILILILICIIIGVNRYKYKYKFTPSSDIPVVPTDNKVSVVKIRNDYYVVRTCVNKFYLEYMSIYDMEQGYKIVDEETEKMIENQQQEGIDAIYSMLDNEYKKDKNITKENLLDQLEEISYSNIDINNMYISEQNENISIYFVYGTLREKNTNNISEFFIMVKTDILNKTFSIFLEDYMDNMYKDLKIGETVVINTEDSIAENKYNIYSYKHISDKEYVTDLFNQYKEEILSNPELVYNKLDEEYRNKRFTTKEEFEQYVKNNTIKNVAMKIDKYKSQKNDNYTQYTCTDQNGNYYIFREISPMNYTLILDTYTIDLPEFTEKYETATTEEKVMLNIQKIVDALNAKDYKYVYGKLVDEFKENYFKTYDAFEKYAENTFDVENEVTFNKYTESENYCTYGITLKGKNKTITKTIVMKLEEGTDFVMSFNVE